MAFSAFGPGVAAVERAGSWRRSHGGSCPGGAATRRPGARPRGGAQGRAGGWAVFRRAASLLPQELSPLGGRDQAAAGRARGANRGTSEVAEGRAKTASRLGGELRMEHAAIQRKFSEALEALIEQVKGDRSILAAILCGSLSHDKVWDKSDIDLVLVTIDDKRVEAGGRSLYADGMNVHAILMPRAEFRRSVEGSVRNSFVHSFLAKGRLLYTHDETISNLCS